jgi:hypothetical protein
MFTRIRMPSLLSLAAASLLLFAGCQTEEPPEAETVLWVRLNDSLSRYERVLVQIVDRNDQATVLGTLWNAVLPAPGSNIPGFPLKNLATQDFIVIVTAYKAGDQLALSTQITYEGGKKSVLHKEVPPLVPLDWLTKFTTSVGALSPAFDKDSLNYVLSADLGTLVTFTLTPMSASAKLAYDSGSITAGLATKPIQVQSNPDTLSFTVTDSSTGTPSKRTYTVVLRPTLPPGPRLGSIVPTAGALKPDFKPTTTVYSLVLPPGVDSVAFVVTTQDNRMTMTVSGKALFSGKQSQFFHVEPTSSLTVPIEVWLGTVSGYYQVTVELSK